MIGMLLGGMLEEMGYEVCTIATTEADAVAAAARDKPDLMIVDARLGDGSGVAAVAAILRTAFIPHLFMTGNVAGVRALRPDAVILEKPFREVELRRAIEWALSGVAGSGGTNHLRPGAEPVRPDPSAVSR
jgi:two-component system, response regulator PdtaR